jgi:hypothetical protein
MNKWTYTISSDIPSSNRCVDEFNGGEEGLKMLGKPLKAGQEDMTVATFHNGPKDAPPLISTSKFLVLRPQSGASNNAVDRNVGNILKSEEIQKCYLGEKDITSKVKESIKEIKGIVVLVADQQALGNASAELMEQIQKQAMIFTTAAALPIELKIYY